MQRTPKFGIITDVLNWHTEFVEHTDGLKTEQKSRVMYMPCDTTYCKNWFRLYLLYFVQFSRLFWYWMKMANTCGFNNSLFGRVSKLVFTSSVIALLDTRISPKILDCFHIWTLKRRYRFIVHSADTFCLILKETFYNTAIPCLCCSWPHL
jgi:hypothetical protein